MTLEKGRLVPTDKKYFVTLGYVDGELEVPVFATSLEEALDLATFKYTPVGFEVLRVRPAV